jgi:hypothetical protein
MSGRDRGFVVAVVAIVLMVFMNDIVTVIRSKFEEAAKMTTPTTKPPARRPEQPAPQRSSPKR